MHPRDCPDWEYANHQNRITVLQRKSTEVIIMLRRGQIDTIQATADTRPIHHRLFLELTPTGYEYYAGHYRGEEFRCLKHYSVGILGDPNVGYSPQLVLVYMQELTRIIQDALAVLDAGHALPDEQLPPEDKLLYTVAAACEIFEYFLRIHPYANGNGHAARFCVWAILGRYNYWPQRGPVTPTEGGGVMLEFQDLTEYWQPSIDMCEACQRGDHWQCSMQTWCECEDDLDGEEYLPPMDEQAESMEGLT